MPKLTHREAELLSYLTGLSPSLQPINIAGGPVRDWVVQDLGMSPSMLSGTLTRLQDKRCVKREASGVWQVLIRVEHPDVVIGTASRTIRPPRVNVTDPKLIPYAGAD